MKAVIEWPETTHRYPGTMGFPDEWVDADVGLYAQTVKERVTVVVEKLEANIDQLTLENQRLKEEIEELKKKPRLKYDPATNSWHEVLPV